MGELQVVPETGTDERMHVLDASCWCHPTVEYVPAQDEIGVKHNG